MNLIKQLYYNDVHIFNILTSDWIEVEILSEPLPPRALHATFVDGQ